MAVINICTTTVCVILGSIAKPPFIPPSKILDFAVAVGDTANNSLFAVVGGISFEAFYLQQESH